MRTKIVAFVSLLTVLIGAFAQANAKQVSTLHVALQGLRAATQLPALVAAPNTSLVASNAQIPHEVHTIFNQIQKFVYGKDTLITLRACDGCQAVADANTMSVYLEPNFLATLKSKFGADSANIIAFVVAHEISHFTYEYITLSSANKLSPNGNIPLLTKSFIDFADLAKIVTMTPQEKQAEVMKYLAMASHAHSEVDLLGLLTLKGMGQLISADAIKYFQSHVTSKTPEERAQSDFDLRLKNVREAVARGEL